MSKDIDPTKITLEEAIKLIEKKKPKEKSSCKAKIKNKMSLDFLIPIDDTVLGVATLLPNQFGENLFKYIPKN